VVGVGGCPGFGLIGGGAFSRSTLFMSSAKRAFVGALIVSAACCACCFFLFGFFSFTSFLIWLLHSSKKKSGLVYSFTQSLPSSLNWLSFEKAGTG
jgi:hypothetical protein